jgi:protein SCO1
MSHPKTFIILSILLLMLLSACKEEKSSAKTAKPQPELLGEVYSEPQPIADIPLTSTKGDIALSDYRGKVVLVYFGYTSCPDICPATSAYLQWAVEELGTQAENVAVVFITVDPERDTLDRIQPYIELFNANFVGVRVEGETLQTVLDEFNAEVVRRQVSDSAMGYLIDHTASIYLIDPAGNLVEALPFGIKQSDIVHDVQIILEEEA